MLCKDYENISAKEQTIRPNFTPMNAARDSSESVIQKRHTICRAPRSQLKCGSTGRGLCFSIEFRMRIHEEPLVDVPEAKADCAG